MIQFIVLKLTLNSEFFKKILFSRNFTDVEFRENKKCKITLSLTDV